MKKISKLLLLCTLSTSSLLAHGLWLNSFEAESHGTTLVSVGLGFGYNLSVEDSIPNRVKLDSFDLITPYGKVITLKKPQKGLEDIYNKDDLKVVDSNFAMHTIKLGKDSVAGTYSVGFSTKTATVIKYLDTKGKTKFSIKPRNKIRNLKKIISTTIRTSYGRAYFINKNWTKPRVIGHKLELIPENDISKLYVGDTIRLKVMFEGNELDKGYVIAKNALSKGDNSLYSPIKNGKAKFLLTNFGQWEFKVKKIKEDNGIILLDKASTTININ